MNVFAEVASWLFKCICCRDKDIVIPCQKINYLMSTLMCRDHTSLVYSACVKRRTPGNSNVHPV